jgi:hypothetical protein
LAVPRPLPKGEDVKLKAVTPKALPAIKGHNRMAQT